ncbi:MAG: PKD domain-containing protein [Alphaproteobacteria bacterium]|nr:PKD domain-containing protein [Alphaproteobacteria bacterium]
MAVSFAIVGLLAFNPGNASAQGRSSDTGQEARQFGLDAPAFINELPPGRFRNRLESLPPQARGRALGWLQDFSFSERDVEFLDVDDNGGIFYVDSILPDDSGADVDPDQIPLYDQDGAGSLNNICDGAPVQTSGVAILHSKPGSANVLFLDLDGGEVPSGTAWGGGPYQTYPYSRDSNYNDVSVSEAADICDIWLRVAEDFAPFDVDVTTEDPGAFDRYTGRVLITRNVDQNSVTMPYSTAGGVAYVNVFGRSNYHTVYSPAFVYYNNLGGGLPKYVAEAASHEMGHNLALSHDGTGSQSYYTGHGSGATSWGPIMGVGYYTNMTQWSQGEYSGASQLQDDIAIITGLLGDEPDDHGNSTGTASTLIVSDGTIDDWGLIETASDVDVFAFQTNGGALLIEALNAPDIPNSSGRPEVGNLDIRLELRDASGATVAADDLNGTPDAQISTSLAAGTYYLFVSGVDDSSIAYSDYGSLGQYYLLGSVNTAPPPNVPPLAGFSHSTNGLTANFTDTSSDSDGSIASWSWNFGDGGTSSAQNPSHTYASAGTRTVSLTVTDDDGASSSTSQSVTVTAANQAPTAAFTASTSDLTATFTDASSDSDGGIASWSWSFGDGGTSNAQNPSHTYASAGTRTVSLTVTDDDGASNSTSQSVTVTAANQAPTAAFTSSTSDLTANFTDASSDSDGSIASWSWNFGDGGTSSAQNPSHAYASAGTRTVSLTVTDDDGASSSTSQSVTVTAANQAPTAPSNLTASVQSTGKGKNRIKTVTLSWSDNSGNEDAFVIERCEETGKGRNKACSWSTAEVWTVGVNANGDVDEPGSGTFKYRVKARNSEGDSGYTNEVKI